MPGLAPLDGTLVSPKTLRIDLWDERGEVELHKRLSFAE
jgi:hypothetical protein